MALTNGGLAISPLSTVAGLPSLTTPFDSNPSGSNFCLSDCFSCGGNSMDKIERAFVLIALGGFYGTIAGLTWLIAS